MYEDQVQELIRDVLDAANREGSFLEMSQVETFEEADIETPDAGLVLTMSDGSQFSLVIVRSS
jgi:hypothetical protein